MLYKGYKGSFNQLERVLLKHTAILKRLAYTDSPFQSMAASLAAQAKIIHIILAGHRLDFISHEIHCVEAVRFGALSRDRNLQAVAQGYLGHHHTLYVPNSDKAIDAFNKGLTCVYSDNSLQISVLYMGLSGAYAQSGDETEARRISMSTIHRSTTAENGESRWQDVPVRAYGPENSGANHATRQILIGNEEIHPISICVILRYSLGAILLLISMHMIMGSTFCMVEHVCVLGMKSM